MNAPIQRQYGLWDSPISSISLARGIGFSDVAWNHDGTLAWRENRSDRCVLVVQGPEGEAPRDLNNEYSARAKVGYGGGDFTAGHDQVYFVEDKSGRLFKQSIDCGSARPITPAFGHFGAPALSPDGNWLLFVHSYERQDCIGIVDSNGELWPGKLVWGDDFYMQPVWHPDAERFAWIAWNHPNMPWEGACLRLGRLKSQPSGLPTLADTETIAGDQHVSAFQPQFSPDGRYLAYVSDATGWWQLYVHDLDSRVVRQLTSEPADHGLPAWIQGMRTHAFSLDGKFIYAIRNQQGFASLWQIDVETGGSEQLPLDQAYTWLEQIAVSPKDGRLALVASGVTTPPRVITYHPGGETLVLKRGTPEDIPSEAYSPAEPISWKGLDGAVVYGLYYPPHNPRVLGQGKPPLIVSIHGGPTSQARASFNPRAQFFATRGFAFLEVNYRGSTGYGRAYWQALNGNWGNYDVEDAISGARFLANAGLVDGERLVIMGGSAGGFTVLQALADYPGTFRAGVCAYGIANQFTAAADTHKFEERYSDSLLGPLPEAAELYRERSPIFNTDKIKDAIIVFQGEDDQVVPRAQSDEIVASLARRGIPHEYHLYPGEGHGFRKTETIEHYYRSVVKFLKQYVIYA